MSPPGPVCSLVGPVARSEGDHLGRGGQSVGAGQHCPDALAAVVGEEERTVVLRRVVALLVEGHAGDGGTAGAAGLAGDHLLGVVVGEVRRCDRARAGGVQVLADAQVVSVVPALLGGAFVAGPAEVGHARGRADDAVDLLPGAPADVADPELAGARAEVEAHRVAQTVRHDPARVEIRAARAAGCRARPVRCRG